MLDDEYLENRVMTAQPHQLHMMVVDGALRHARAAVEALENTDYEAAHFALNDARGFVSELAAGLDEERLPEVVRELKLLFAFAYKCFVHADLERSPKHVHDAIRVLELHRETWKTITDVANMSDVPQQPAPGGPVLGILTENVAGNVNEQPSEATSFSRIDLSG